MAGNRELKITIIGDASSAQKALGSLDNSTEKTKGKFSKLGGALAGMAVAGGATALFKGAIDAANESIRVAKQTDAVLKSTGGAAKVSADHIGTLAHQLQNLSGVQDETIQSGQNMLLTFTSVKNQVGAGNDIFDQATKTMLDMSVALKQDVKSSAIQLGKALNDPIKGVSALRRVGVQFTDQQKDQIEKLVESGKTLEAQKLILKELNTEFGGSAKAAGDAMTPMQRLSLTLGDLQETIGTKLLPVIQSLASWLEKHKSIIVPLAALIGGVLVAAFIAWAAAAVSAAADTVAAMASAAASAAVAAAGFVVAFAPVIAIGAAVALLAVVVIKNWDTIKGAIGAAIEFIKGLVGGLIDVFKKIPGWIADAMKGLANIITAPYRAAFNAIAKLWNNTLGKLHFKLPKWIPGIGGKGFDMPNIPTFASGVTNFGGGLAVVGESGPELVRLPRGSDVIPNGKAGGVMVNMENHFHDVPSDAAFEMLGRQLGWRLAGVGGM